MMPRYSIGDKVLVTVEAIHPWGVNVRLPNGDSAYIRCRELALDPKADPFMIVQVNETIQTVVTSLPAPGLRLEVSRRLTLEDPWPSFTRRFHEDDVVWGRVRELTGEGAFIQLTAGVSGFCHKEDLAPWPVERPEDLLSVEDHVEAVLTRLNPARRRIDLNIRLRALKLDEVGRVVEKVKGAAGESFEEEPARIQYHEAAPLSPGQEWDLSEPPTGDYPQTRFERLLAALSHISQLLGTISAILFEFDPFQQRYSVSAQVGDEPLNEVALYSLQNSPVANVIQRRTPIREENASGSGYNRMEKLLDLLEFEACIGLPVEVAEEVHHAVFFFSPIPGKFSAQHLRDAEARVCALSALLELNQVDQQMRRLNPSLVQAQMGADMSHEMGNKLINLRDSLNGLRKADPRGIQDWPPQSLKDALRQLEDIQETLALFNPQADWPNSRLPISVNDAIRTSLRLMKTQIENADITAALYLDTRLPPVYGPFIALQQVISNLVLNAKQQMEEKTRLYGWSGGRRLEVHTQYDPSVHSIRVIVKDSGPGIHRALWEHIYKPGVSNRGGHGLGLYISRKLLEPFHGSLFVSESYIPLGATFEVQLPVDKAFSVAH